MSFVANADKNKKRKMKLEKYLEEIVFLKIFHVIQNSIMVMKTTTILLFFRNANKSSKHDTMNK